MAESISKTTTKKPAVKAAPAKAVAPAAKATEKKAAVAKKPAVEKKVAAAKPAAAKKPAAKAAASKKMTVTAEQHYCMVAEAAYYRAERNGFMSDPVRDWIEAENEISAMLAGRK